ncbi:hypothetical protein IQ235_16965 [Oscillatoriales cyanobacterium LEGE 11467]|uniref:Uncharacterized protein n=1 Tax=Zarconia navalis LEGE 11467 TaxID=1828826 RepID=A0A928W3D2_9CYAN|nr:hypothetical protein [Zarconia navalis]MBE9042465.1 hypothetical protein [Zarconia navalis LEGE 11467]
MTVAIPVLKPVSQIELAPGSSIAIPNVSWAEYEAILQEIGEHRSARVAYSFQIQYSSELRIPRFRIHPSSL